MKIAHLSFSCKTGGAAISSSRIHRALLEKGITSHLYSEDPTPENNNYTTKMVIPPIVRVLNSKLSRVTSSLLTENSNANYFMVGFSSWANYLKQQKYDILHIHWPYRGLISLRDLRRINIPIVWTLHDSWPIQEFSFLPTEERRKNNLIAEIFVRNKRKSLYNINYVAPSNWMFNYAVQNKIKNITRIKNPLNIDQSQIIKKPLSKNWRAKDNLKLGFVSGESLNAYNKGFDKISKNLASFDRKNISLNVIGAKVVNNEPAYNCLNFIPPSNSKFKMQEFYEAIDYLLVPSRFDNYPNVILEAIAYGVPVIGEKTSGITEMVRDSGFGILLNDKNNGWDDLLEVILAMDAKKNTYINRKMAIKWIESHSYKKISKQYIELYEKLLN